MLLLKSLLQLIQFFTFLILNRNSLIPKVALLWKENQKYKRICEQKNISISFTIADKWFIRTMYSISSKARKYFTLVKPETVLYSWKKAIRNYWTHNTSRSSKCGRPPITKVIKELIKNIKICNYLWGCKRIEDELKKVNINISRETIRKVIQDFRKSGDIKPNYSWRTFIKSHWRSLFACDFFTVDIFGFKRFYIFFIMELRSRRIVLHNITSSPSIRFLRNQISYFEELYPDSYLIHDNSGELKYFLYDEYNINDVPITPYSPNMNAYAERFIRSVRQECLDWFIIFSEKQLSNIIKKYIEYYNKYRPHQGIKSIPEDKPPDKHGKIKKKSVLFGLHHNYYRKAS